MSSVSPAKKRDPGQVVARRGAVGANDHALPAVIPLVIECPGQMSGPQPITLGVPLPRGYLSDSAALSLQDPSGQPALLQSTSLACWPDSSIKWLLLDFVLPRAVEGTSEWTLRQVSGSRSGQRTAGLHLSEDREGFDVDTGVASFRVERAAGLLSRARIEGAEILKPGAARLLLTDSRGRLHILQNERLEVEERGPVRATLRCSGSFPGRRPIRFTGRLCFFAGTGLVRWRLTVHNPHRARHPGGLWDLGDPGSIFFRDLSLVIQLHAARDCEMAWAAEHGQELERGPAGRLEIYQDSSGGENWKSRNHLDRYGEVPCSFQGYRVRCNGRERHGLRASPVVSLETGRARLTAAVPEFWEQFPRAIEIDGNSLSVRLFPGQFGDLFELQGGEQKTHTFWLDIAPDRERRDALSWVHQPSRARTRPEWYARSGAFPHLEPDEPDDDPRLRSLLAEVVSGPNSFAARREIIDEFGWRNFGDLYADHEGAYYAGPSPVISHYNNQYDVVYGAILQYLRTGDAGWLAIFDPLARHVIDIDIYHTTQDRAAYNGGLFWHTDHYKTAAICTHRTYSRANCRPGDRTYGGGPGSTHNYTSGLLHYYYLTGEPLAREAVLSLAGWVLDMDDGTKNVLGAIDGGPTGLASQTGAGDYHGPGRGSGNSVNALLDAWLLTGEGRYMDKAEQLIRRSIHPADDLGAGHLLHAEEYFSYTIFLSALDRYLHLSAEGGDAFSCHAYARASLLRYARWMADNERPYLDHADELEYPTETWAGQELRKANVMRRAAGWAPEPLRSMLLTKGEALADRAWRDLTSFPTRTSTRVMALVMVEGARDAYFRSCGVPNAPPASGEIDFGTPERFSSQKARVFRQLKSPRGLVAALCRVSNPARWWRYCLPPWRSWLAARNSDLGI